MSLVPVALLLFAGVANAQAIQGTVVVPSARPPERIEVLLLKDGQVILRSQTDSAGHFFLRGMPYGGYEVVARADGWEETRTNVDLSPPPAGISLQIMTLQLDRKDVAPVVQYGEPVIDVTQLSQDYPKKVRDEFDKGVSESRKGNASKAVKHFETVVQEAPNSYDAHNLLGSMYQKLDRFRDAEKEYNTARQLNPRSALPLTNLGTLYIREADWKGKDSRPRGQSLDDALDALDEAVKVDAQAAMAFYLLGVAYSKSDFDDAAEKHFRRALDLEPRMGVARLGLLNVYTKLGQWQNAVDQLDAFLEENPRASNRDGLAGIRRKLVENARVN